MNKFTSQDLKFSIITGLTTGVVAWQIFNFLSTPRFNNISFAWLIVILPILWIIGVNLGYLFGKWFSFFNQFGKFAAIGFTNAAVDFGVLNLLISLSGFASGTYFSIFKGVSFIAAVIHSYIWNKYWVFGTGENKEVSAEFLKFISVAAVALVINVGTASFVVNFIDPYFGLSPEVWANVGAVVGSAISLAISFTGFKFLVFKK